MGRSGGGRSVYGERSQLLASCCNAVPYSLVVVGNVFLGKGRSARLRMTRELQDSIESRMKLPVVTADELRAHYLFGRRDVFRLVGFLALVVAIYALVLTHQDHVLGFLSSGWAAAGPLGKAAVEVPDQAGFVVNRLLFPYLFDAVRMLERTGMEAGEVDTCMRLGAGHPMGPLRVSDLVGLDVRLAIAEYLHRELKGAHYAPPEILRAKVRAGELGKKTGRGFYEWPTKSS